ncbi:MAG: ribose 5-phosphate isomerase B [Candidatus Zixiibacteriota bacterium]
MKIAVGSDHAGFELKEAAKKILKELGHEIIDLGTDGKESVDYSDFGLGVARAVANHTVDRGVAVCWTGNGMMIAVNKVRGIRGTLCLNKDMAHLARAHNDSNILVLAEKYIEMNNLADIIKEWLEVEFEGGRHTRRLDKIKNAEC